MKAFVLMPFAPPIGAYYEHIFRPALEAAGYAVSRADDLFAPRPIILDIQESISAADLILCEMTGKNPNVFYELGLAHALGKSTILVARREEDIPFDLRHIRVILYEPTEAGWESSLQRQIIAAARATMDSRPSWPPPMVVKPGHRQGDRPKTVELPNRKRRDRRMSNNEQVLMRFPTEDGSVVSGPYPYRFVLKAPYRCALLVDAQIWSAQSAYENVIQVMVDGIQIAEIREGYERFQSARIELGNIDGGRHLISFDAHYEGLDGEVINARSPASQYWILRRLTVVGELLI